MSPTYVACVLAGKWPQTAPELGEAYVKRLAAAVQKHCSPEVRFVCFTDRAPERLPGIETRSLPAGLFGWFNKLYLFAPEAFELGARVLYLDLDTVVRADLKALLAVDSSEKPVFLHTVCSPVPRRAASGVVSFHSGPQFYPIWQEFKEVGFSGRKPPYLHPLRGHPMRGKPGWIARSWIEHDEDWIHRYIYPDGFQLWRDMLPEHTVLSYRCDLKGDNSRKLVTPVQDNTSVIFFHGNPRPHKTEYWL